MVYDLTMHIEQRLRIAEHKLKMSCNALDQAIRFENPNVAQFHADNTGCACVVSTLKELLDDVNTLSTNQTSFIINGTEFKKV